MLGLLEEAGYGISSSEEDAAVVVVNTCSFIQEAREESVRTLVGFAEQGKLVGEEWHKMSESAKQPFCQMAAQDKRRYQNDLIARRKLIE